jgi:hypothetical protein
MRRPNGCAVVRWRTSCVDQKAPVRACVVTLSVGVIRSFPEGLYIGGEAEFSANSLARGGSALSFSGALGERGREV